MSIKIEYTHFLQLKQANKAIENLLKKIEEEKSIELIGFEKKCSNCVCFSDDGTCSAAKGAAIPVDVLPVGCSAFEHKDETPF